MEYKYSFERLEVWQDARLFVREVYSALKSFPQEERYILCPQIQRAAISVVSNIAEGVSRSSEKEKTRFLEIAYSSLMEVCCQLYIAYDLTYITKEQLAELKLSVDKISNKLNALIRSIKKNN
jgi:S23 ribosomal protein.